MQIYVYRLRKLLWGAGCAVAAGALLRWPQAAATGVSRGLSLCGEVIIPSLLPMLVLGGVIIRTGVSIAIGRRAAPLVRRLFGLPGSCASALLIGAIGGYPAGAAATRTLLESGEITQEEAARLLCCCVNGGPAFIIGAVGIGMLGSIYKGIILYITNILASFLIGLFTRRKSRTKPAPCRPQKAALKNGQKAFVQAVSDAVQGLLAMCGFVLLFSSILSLLDAAGVARSVTAVLEYPFTRIGVPVDLTGGWLSIWEVSCGCAAITKSACSPVGELFLLGAALGWGGISVHCQIGALFSTHSPALVGGRFRLAAAWHALLGGALAMIGWWVLPQPAGGGAYAAANAAVQGVVTQTQTLSVSAAASAFMLILCGAFLLYVAQIDG